jgi:CBS domain-containing protein
MHLAKHILRSKTGPVATIAPAATVLDAAREMNQRRIGSLVVVDSAAPIGIITERDILTRVVAEEQPPAATHVSEVMSHQLITCTSATPLDEIRRLMRERRIRHVPVVEDGQLLGIISLGDLNLAENVALAHTVQYLEDYISH